MMPRRSNVLNGFNRALRAFPKLPAYVSPIHHMNVAEGSGVAGGNRRQRYATALGSARETMACFDVAVAMDYIGPLGAEARDRLDRVIATLVKVSR